jgi:hypothetical protein
MKKQICLSIAGAALLTTATFSGAMPKMAGHPPVEPSAKASSEKPSAEPLTGKVLQTMNSGGYTFVQLEQKKGASIWLATSEIAVKIGSRMSFKPGVQMHGFESKSLKRTFETIIFSDGVLDAQSAQTAPVSKPGAASVSPGSKGVSAHKTVTTPVTRAPGANAYTVEETFTKRSLLDKKKIIIRGKVTKVSNGIMGKNWVHIQDGSGSEAKANHDLVCTSQDKAMLGDMVIVTGTLAKDRDFGSGYTYAVIIEDAHIKK